MRLELRFSLTNNNLELRFSLTNNNLELRFSLTNNEGSEAGVDDVRDDR